jgi:hypothetical protein
MMRTLNELVANDALDCADAEIVEDDDHDDVLVASGLWVSFIEFEDIEAALRDVDLAMAEPAR